MPTIKVHLNTVTVGRDFGVEIEILSGVDAQDRARHLNPPDSLLDGATVTVLASSQRCPVPRGCCLQDLECSPALSSKARRRRARTPRRTGAAARPRRHSVMLESVPPARPMASLRRLLRLRVPSIWRQRRWDPVAPEIRPARRACARMRPDRAGACSQHVSRSHCTASSSCDRAPSSAAAAGPRPAGRSGRSAAGSSLPTSICGLIAHLALRQRQALETQQRLAQQQARQLQHARLRVGRHCLASMPAPRQKASIPAALSTVRSAARLAPRRRW